MSGSDRWKSIGSIGDEPINNFEYVNCININSEKAEFDRLEVTDLSLIEPYSDISLSVANILKAKDISLDEIKLENHIDTDGVIEFIKPINVLNASIQEIRGYDGLFSSVSVENKLIYSIIDAKTNNEITINSDASFYNAIQSNNMYVNEITNINDSTDQPIRFMCDVSINKTLIIKDISVSHINKLNNDNTFVFNTDVSMKDILYASDFSAELLRARELSANDIYGSNNHVQFISDISNNSSIEINEISLNTLGASESRITIFNNVIVEDKLQIGGELSLNNLYSDSQYINFNDNTVITHSIEKPDISINEINPSEPPLQNIQADTSNILIINSDVSFNSIADLDWVNSAFNVIARYHTMTEVINTNYNFDTGSMVEILNTDGNNKAKVNIYIKIDNDSWHKLVDANNSPWYKNFTLSYEGINLLTDDDYNKDIKNNQYLHGFNYITEPLNSITDISVGLQHYFSNINFASINTIKFYVKKIKIEENNTYKLTTLIDDLELDTLTLRRRKNTSQDAISNLSISEVMNSFDDFSYNYGAGWDIRLFSGNVDIDDGFEVSVVNTDISNLDIKVPINNGFDVSFILEVRDDVNVTINPKLIYIIKVNDVPNWTEFKLDASNQDYYSHKGIQIIDHPNEHAREGKIGIYNDISFDVSYDKPVENVNEYDTSYYNLDLSAIDPEGFDVSYYIETKPDDFNDWSWNWSADNSNILKIKVPGEGINGIDVSLVILAHDNNVPDVENLIPNDLYRNDDIETSYNRTIITFRKQNVAPIWNCIKLGVSNDQFDELDQSWNDTIDDDGNQSHQFYVYFEPDKKYVKQKNENFSTDLSSYFLDLSSTDPEGFDSSYYVLDLKSDISHIITNDYSRIQIDISSILNSSDMGYDMSLEILSQDDWSYNFTEKRDHNRVYTTRTLNFKHISSQLLQEFKYNDISSADDSQLYLVNDNSYEILYSKNNSNMLIKLIFDNTQFPVELADLTIDKTVFSEYDISVASNGTHNVIDISGLTKVNTDNNSGYIDISFELLFKETFKYNFFITNYYLTGGDGSFSDITASNITIKNSDSNNNVNPLLQVFGDISATGRLDAYDASFENDLTTGIEVILAGAGGMNGTGDLHGSATASSVDGIREPSKAFNNTILDEDDCWFSSENFNTNPQWLAFEFPYDVIISRYKIWPSVKSTTNYSPKDWKLQGSTNETPDTWIDIHNQTGINDWINLTDTNSIVNDTNNKEFVVDTTDHPSAYRNFRLYISGSANGSQSVSVGQVAFYGSPSLNFVVDISNDLVVEHDVSINSRLDVYDASFRNNVTISTDLIVKHDISINNKLDAHDSSFHNNVTLVNNLDIGNDVSINSKLSAYDASFNNNVTIPNDLIVNKNVMVANNHILNGTFQNNAEGWDYATSSSFNMNYDKSNYVKIPGTSTISQELYLVPNANYYVTFDASSSGIYPLLIQIDDVTITTIDASYSPILTDAHKNFSSGIFTTETSEIKLSFKSDGDFMIGNVILYRINTLSAIDAGVQNNVGVTNHLLVKNDVSITNHLSALQGELSFLKHSNDTIPSLLPSGRSNISIDGTWLHVRHIVTNDTILTRPSVFVDNLVGTSSSGTPSNNSENWTIQFDNIDYDQMLFFNDGYKNWAIIEKHDFTSAQQGFIDIAFIQSYKNQTQHTGKYIYGNNLDALSICVDLTYSAADAIYSENINNSNENAKYPFDIYVRLSPLSPSRATFRNNVTVANDLHVGNDVSINSKMDDYDVSFHNNVTIAKDLVIEHDVSINNKLDDYDASFHNNVTIANDLVIEHDVSINHILDAYDASFHNDVTVDNNLVIEHDVSINTYLSAMDTSFHNDVTIVNDLVVEHDISVNGQLDAFDVSFHNNLIVDNDISCGGAVKAPQVFAGTGPFDIDVRSSHHDATPPVFVGSNSNSDAVMRLEGTDGSGCEIVGSGSGDNRFGINIINDTATSKSNALTISNDGNVGINNPSPTVKLDVGGDVSANDISGVGMVPIGGIIMWSSNVIPDGWYLCDGNNDTPDLSEMFVMGVGIYNASPVSGGEDAVTLDANHLPQHEHTVNSGNSITSGENANWDGTGHEVTVSFEENNGHDHGISGLDFEVTHNMGSHKHAYEEQYIGINSADMITIDNTIDEGKVVTQSYVAATYTYHPGTQYAWVAMGWGGPYIAWGYHAAYTSVKKAAHYVEVTYTEDLQEGVTDYLVTSAVNNLTVVDSGHTNPLHVHIDSNGKTKNSNSVTESNHDDWKTNVKDLLGWGGNHIHNHVFAANPDSASAGDSNVTPYDNLPPYIVLAYIMRYK